MTHSSTFQDLRLIRTWTEPLRTLMCAIPAQRDSHTMYRQSLRIILPAGLCATGLSMVYSVLAQPLPLTSLRENVLLVCSALHDRTWCSAFHYTFTTLM